MAPRIPKAVKAPGVQYDFWAGVEYLRDYGGLTAAEFKKITLLDCGISNTKRGRACHKNGKYYKFYVPYWAYLKEDIFLGLEVWPIRSNPNTDRLSSLFVYYLAHEISHVLNSPKAKSHGRRFYEIFTRVCPVELQHYELTYKTKTASKYIKELV